MIKLYALTFLFFCSLAAFAGASDPEGTRNELNNGKISGVVTDSTTRKPVEYATVALMAMASDKPVDGAVCDDKGKFAIRNIAPGKYRVVISFIGYETKTIPVTITDKNNEINLGEINISVTAEILNEVVVEGQKSLIEERVDRTIYNAENDATARGGDASDVLKRVPMLTVDMDGNVSLRGNQNIQVLINNKPSTIIASNIGDALKQIPADQIKSVEVITAPSARYDAEGSAGIINIITKKNTLQGLTMNIDTGIGLRGSNLGLSGNYRRKKMGFSLGGFGRAMYNVTGKFENEQSRFNQSGEVISTTTQSASTLNRRSFGSYTLGWDYDINEKNFMTASIRYGLRNGRRTQDNLFEESILQSGTFTSIRDTWNKENGNSVDASLTFTHLFEVKQRELSFQGQFSRNNADNEFFSQLIEGNTPGQGTIFTNINDSHNEEVTVQVDYQTPIGTNQMVEVGAKDIMRRVYSDFNTTGAQSNNLNYDQNVVGAYLSYTLTMNKGYSLKAGTRYEYTTINAYSATENNIEIPSYGVVVPSVNFSKKLKDNKTLKFSYNRRIQRPSIRFLNPNTTYEQNQNFTVGNPRLDPEFTNNFEVGYSTFIKGTSLNFTAFARNTNDAIQSLRQSANDGTNAIATTFDNIGTENAYGTSMFANVNIGKLSLNGGGDLYYAMLSNNSPDERFSASNEGWVVSGRLFGGYTLSKGWAAQFFAFGRGRNINLQGYQGNFAMYSLGFRKDFNNKKGSLGLAGENFVTPSIRIRSETITPEVRQFNVNTLNNISVRVTFSYRIGKMSMDQRPRRRAKSINNDDMKEGGDGGMDAGGGGGGGMQRGGGGTAPVQRPQGNPKPAAVEPEKPADSKTDSAAVAAPVAAEGTWSYTVESPQGTGGGKLTITKTETGYSGIINNPRFGGDMALSSVTVNGNEMSFSYDVNRGGNNMTIMVKGTVSGKDFTGTMQVGQFGAFPFNASKDTP